MADYKECLRRLEERCPLRIPAGGNHFPRPPSISVPRPNRHMGRLGRACFFSVRAYLSCFRILFACQSGLVRLDANAAGQSLLAL